MEKNEEKEFVKKLYIETNYSEKSKKNYTGLYVDLGYGKQLLTCDKSILMFVSNMTPTEYMNKSAVIGFHIDII